MKESNKKNRYMQIRLSQEEYDAIEKKFQNSGMRSRSDFIRAMIFDGIIVHFDEKELRKTNQLIANIGNNINQIAVRVNTQAEFMMKILQKFRMVSVRFLMH